MRRSLCRTASDDTRMGIVPAPFGAERFPFAQWYGAVTFERSSYEKDIKTSDRIFSKATPHKCNDTHCRIAILWKAIGLPRTFARKSALTQAARQGLSARIRFANANMMLNLAPCFSSPRYRVFRKRSCFLTTPNTCSTFARTEDFACSAFFAAY